MSLAEVADKGRQTILHRVQNQAYAAAMLEILRDIEADPDFKLRERIEALAKEWDAQHVPEYLTPQQYANRLRSILEAKP